MRVGMKATVISTGYVGTIENIEEKRNGTWVQIDAKKYRDSNVSVDYNGVANGPMPMITDENRQEFIDSAADDEDGIVYGEQDLTGVVDDATEAMIQQIAADAGLTQEQATYENPSSEGQDATRFCECGCGEVLAKKSSFRQGHDQRHKGQLIRMLEAGGDDGLEAGIELVRRGWKSQGEVDVRYNRIAKRAARKAAEATNQNQGSAQALPV